MYPEQLSNPRSWTLTLGSSPYSLNSTPSGSWVRNIMLKSISCSRKGVFFSRNLKIKNIVVLKKNQFNITQWQLKKSDALNSVRNDSINNNCLVIFEHKGTHDIISKSVTRPYKRNVTLHVQGVPRNMIVGEKFKMSSSIIKRFQSKIYLSKRFLKLNKLSIISNTVYGKRHSKLSCFAGHPCMPFSNKK